jgi:hypothetical protein
MKNEPKGEFNLLDYKVKEQIRRAWSSGKMRIKLDDRWFGIMKNNVGNVDYLSVFPESEKTFVPVANFPLSERQYADEMSRRGELLEKKPRPQHQQRSK